VDERVIVNAMVALLATAAAPTISSLGGGGARRRHRHRLDRLRDLSAAVPLLARVYPTAAPT